MALESMINYLTLSLTSNNEYITWTPCEKKGITYILFTVGNDDSGYAMLNHNDIVFKSCQTATHMTDKCTWKNMSSIRFTRKR